MSQAQDELVARATDPDAELSTLHELAQSYPGLRPHIAANPRTYPALLEWLGTLHDPEVNAALAARAQWATTPQAQTQPVQVVTAQQAPVTQSVSPGLPVEATTAAPALQVPAQQVVYQQPVPAVSPGVFGVGTDEHEQADRHRSSTWLWVLAALTLVLVVAGAVWFMSSRGDDQTSARSHDSGQTQSSSAQDPESATAEASEEASASPSRSPSASPSPTPSASAKMTAPAPSGAIEMSSFTSPSGNITCVLGKESVTCTVNEHDFVPTDASCSSSNSKPFTASVTTTGDSSGSCSSGFDKTGATLAYGASAKSSAFACTSTENGVDCWSQQTGKGFTIARSGASAKQH